MPKFDPSALPPVPAKKVSKTFTAKGGQEFTITINVSDSGEQMYAIVDKQREIYDKWSVAPPCGPSEAPLKVSQTLCLLIARILVMQTTGEGETEADLWTEHHWAVLSQRDSGAFNAVQDWVQELLSPPENPTPAPPPA